MKIERVAIGTAGLAICLVASAFVAATPSQADDTTTTGLSSDTATIAPYNDGAASDFAFSSTMSTTSTDSSAAEANCAAGSHSGTTSVFSHHFTVSSVNCKRVDSDGTFNGQITFTGHWPMAWSYKINQSSPYAVAANSNVTEAADYYNTSTKKRITSYHDSHVEPIDYFYHSSTPVNDGDVGYQLDILFIWKFRTANTSGTAQLYVTFNYTAYGPE